MFDLSNAQPYQLIAGGKGESYKFITDEGVDYLVSFDDISADFTVDDIGNSIVLEFQFYPINGNQSASDKRIMATIMECLTKVTSKSSNVILYVCESSDSKGEARDKYFDALFLRNSPDYLEKLDGKVAAGDGSERYEYISVIIHKDNPDYTTVYDTFQLVLNNIDRNKNPMFRI